LGHELRKTGLLVAQQQGITVIYDGFVVGDYNVDILVEGTIIIELKAIKALDNAHTATGLHLCMLLNFGKPCPETPAHGPRSLKPLGISACIGVHRWLKFLACLMAKHTLLRSLRSLRATAYSCARARLPENFDSRTRACKGGMHECT
jgi:hypothetical protein